MRISRLTLIGLATILLASLLTYGPTLRAGLVWDDDFHFASNPHMRSLHGLVEIWTSRAAVYYPLTLTSFWLLIRMFGFSPFALHGANLALHTADALLLWLLLRRLRLPGGWLAALLFLVHPLHVETVAWITELKNTQSTFFFLVTLLCAERAGLLHGQIARWPWRWAALAAFGLALLSKPAVVMLPVVLLLLLWWQRRVSLASIRHLAPFFLLSALAAGWTIWEQRFSSGATGFEWNLSAAARLGLAGRVAWFYLAKLVWPHPLMFIYPRWDVDPSAGLTYLPLLGGAALLAGLAVLSRRRPLARAGLAAILIYLANLFPVMGFFDVYFTRYSFVADHFAYLPSLSLLALVGAGLTRLGQPAPSAALSFASWRVRLPAVCAIAALLAGSAMVLAVRHARAFRSEDALWMDTLARNPGAWMVHNNLGASLLTQGQTERAETHFREALRYNPQHYEALSNLGNILLQRGDVEGAIAAYEQALAWRPDFALVWVNLGLAYDRHGDAARALDCYRRALACDFTFYEAYVKMAGLHERDNRIGEAIADFTKALDLHGASTEQRADFFFRRAREVAAPGHTALAAAYEREALRLLSTARVGPPPAP